MVKPKSSLKPTTPAPVDGRRHMSLQTDRYLEELTDVIPEQDTSTQTDAFLDRPPTPLYVPQKGGLDVSTQIEDGDLFDFDFEVEPILEAIVGRVLESSVTEVVEEEELLALKRQQEEFEAKRTAELVEVQRMEEAERRKLEEKERRFAQERQRLQLEEETRRKVAARTFARGFLSGLFDSVVDRLHVSGYFYDPIQREIQENVMPALLTKALSRIKKDNVARQVTQQLVRTSVELAVKQRKAADERLAMQAQAAAAHEDKMARLRQQQAEQAAQLKAQRGNFILHDLHPRVVHNDVIASVRSELEAAAQARADATWEQAKQDAGQQRREQVEAELANAQAAQPEGGEAAEDNQGEDGIADSDAAPALDIEGEVQAAMDAVTKPEPARVTEDDILNSLLESGKVTKDQIVQSLALYYMGNKAYSVDPLFADEIQPVIPS